MPDKDKPVELKPCPFCGGEAETTFDSDEDGDVWKYVACTKCHVQTDGHSKTLGAIKAWNRRVQEAPHE